MTYNGATIGLFLLASLGTIVAYLTIMARQGRL